MFKQTFNFVLLGSMLVAGTTAPERKVEGNRIISDRDPKVQIQLPSSVQYIGADRWVLYGMADCELHAFVDADPQKNVQRLYWIQFESYLPTRPELHHTYDSPRHATLGGMDFYLDTWLRDNDAETRPGSDIEHILAIIRAKGFHMPNDAMYVRLVHLLDEQKRKELMIIYAENLAPTGFSAADLQPSGKAHNHWPSIERGLIKRAEESLKITSPSNGVPQN